MKRYHEEKHIIDRRLKENGSRSAFITSPTPGRYRKTHIGCNKAACQLCHPEKYPKRVPTRKEQQAKHDARETG
jgi:hypothetical protein